MIFINPNLIEQIISQAKAELPNECCGMLAGIISAGEIKIVEIFPMTNIDQSPEHFSLDPREQFQVLRSAREKGLKLLGNYHSHPATPSRPSQEDIRLAYDREAIYAIVSLASEPVLKFFSIGDGVASELAVTISETKEKQQ